MATNTNVLPSLVAQRSRPTPAIDGNTQGIFQRGGRYGEALVQPVVSTKHNLADEGAYFTAQNPTIGTGVVTAAAVTSYASTNAFFVIFNRAPLGGARLYLDYLRLIVTSATTAVVSVDFLGVVDYINRFPSTAANGTALVPVNVNGDDGTGSNAVIQAYNANGAMTVPAASAAARVCGRGHLASGICIVGDEYIVQFGATERTAMPGLTAVDATQPRRCVTDMSPMIIGPQQYGVIHRWSLTEAATMSYEFELGWWER